MSRKLTVEAEPLGERYILGLREQFATAEHHGAKFEFDHMFGFGSTTIALTAIFPGGRRVTETIQLQSMFAEWAEGLIDSNFIVRGAKWPDSEFLPCQENGEHLLSQRHTRDECPASQEGDN